ncbi:MAG: peptide deformylase [Elusimicrobiota bacterium]
MEIVKYPSPVLKKKCSPVLGITSETKGLIKNMVDMMRASNGLGLAANQIGHPVRILVISLPEKDGKPSELVLINPTILQKRGKIFEEEGCLSFPGFYTKIKRHKKVVVSAINERGKTVEIMVEDLLSRVIQHEIDHLNGISFVQRLPFLQRIKTLLDIHRRIKKGTWS